MYVPLSLIAPERVKWPAPATLPFVTPMPLGPGFTGPSPVPFSVSSFDLAARGVGEVMRVTVFDGKLLTHTDSPLDDRAGATEPVVGGAKRIGAPASRPECTSIDSIVPASSFVPNTKLPATASELGFVPTRMGSPIGRSVRGSRRTTSPFERSANQTFRPARAMPTGKPPT